MKMNPQFYGETANLTTDVSRVSESTKTSSPVSENRGTAINRTVWPPGPSMEAVSNFGCEPTKNICGQEFNTKGSSS
jgi:hypothetical protein